MSIKKRAISVEQKLERRNNILKTALELFKNSSFNGINIEEIAKGTVFLYLKKFQKNLKILLYYFYLFSLIFSCIQKPGRNNFKI